MAPRRKVPFSGKAKKEQLKLKRERKQLEQKGEKRSIPFLQSIEGNQKEDDSDDDASTRVMKINAQPTVSKKNKDTNRFWFTILTNNLKLVDLFSRYALKFYKESKEELEAKKKEAFTSLNVCKDDELEIKLEDYFPEGIDFPKRPPWSFNMSKEELDAKEHRYFTEYVNNLEKQFGHKKLSYFELNLETWRQLWRVIEMADIVLIIVDIRYAALMFPPSLYHFICYELKKDMILVLNKIDLAPANLVVAWKHYFLEHYPNLKIITFTSFPSYNLRNQLSENKSGLQVRRKRGKLRMAAEGAQKLYETCKDIVQNQVDLSSWAKKISDEMHNTYDDGEEPNIITEKLDTSYQEHIRYKSGTLTIGCLGQPNVGKSSLMNAIMGKKVVSVSRTPGHTKHFQTIYLTKNVILCDCPGLVFPSLIPRTLQILIGAYPIAQVREPYSAVKYLAERLNIQRLLNIKHPENDDIWSAMDICDGWARQRGFFTAKAARPDVYRAANHILRMALDGKICLCLKPPGYFSKQDYWKNHEEVTQIEWIQAKGNVKEISDDLDEGTSDSVEEREKITSQRKEQDTDSDESAETESEEVGLPSKTKLANKFELLASTED